MPFIRCLPMELFLPRQAIDELLNSARRYRNNSVGYLDESSLGLLNVNNMIPNFAR